MKHTLKILIPILLILALLIGACCFFLIARRDLTESVFTYWGNHFYNNGRYGRAITCYKLAMHFAPKDAELAIWLSNAYKRSGNYTKAEYTLVNAITQSPDAADLYIALSKTYVEQDKLLDAETMLGRITNDAVRTQIDALRPDKIVCLGDIDGCTDHCFLVMTEIMCISLHFICPPFPSVR